MEDDLDDYLEIEADTTDFTMNESYCIATNSVFSRLDLSNMNDLDDLKDAMNDLDDATMQLMDGSSDLYDGVSELYDKSGDLIDGVKELSDGSNDLRDGAYQLADGTVTLRDGIGALKSGANTLQDGTKTLQSGAVELNNGLAQLTSNNATLNAGAAQVFDTLIATVNSSDGVKLLVSQGLMNSLTKENYAAEMTAAIQKLTYLSTNEAATRALVLAANGLTEEKYQYMKNFSADTASTASQPAETTDVPVADNTDAATADVPAEDTTDTTVDSASVSGGDASPETDTVTEPVTETAPVAENTPAAPVVQATNPFAETVAKIDAATQGYMKTFGEAVPTLTATKASLDSYNTFYQGLLAYTAGVASANAGATRLAAGTTQLVDGADKLASGSKDLLKGANTLLDGSKDLASGAGTLANGVNTLSDGSDALVDGIRQLKDGAKELKDGIVQFNDEGISKLTELDTDELQEVIDRMKATASVSENYDSFTGSDNNMNSSVKFIYKINAVK